MSRCEIKKNSRCNWLHSWPALIVLATACFRLASPDVPLGLAWGRAIYERGTLPATNIFSHMNTDHVVLLDKWLFQLTIYIVHLATGPAGLVCLRVALLAVALFAAAKAAKLRWNRSLHAWLGVLFTIALLNRCYVRAELVTWAAIPLTLCLIPLVIRGEKRGWILLVLLQAAWANSHSYWIVGPMLWAAAAAGSTVQPLLKQFGWSDITSPDKRTKLQLLIAAAVAVLAACLTPYGLKTIAHPIRLALELQTTDILSRAVDDFGSPIEAISRGGTIPLWACLAVGFLGLVALASIARHRRLDGQKLAIFVLGLLLGLHMYRNLTILAICALPLVADWMREPRTSRRSAGAMAVRMDTNEHEGKSPKRWRYSFAVIPALLWLGVTFMPIGQATDYGARKAGFGWNVERYPMPVANWIARNMPDAKLWNDFGEGGWLNFRLGEGHTYIDGNTDGYPLDYLRHYHETWRVMEIKDWFPAGSDIDAALVEHGESVHNLGRFLMGISWMESPSIAYADKQYAVVLPTTASPDANPDLTAKLFRSIARRVNASIATNRFSLNALTATDPQAEDDMFLRSGRLAIRLYPKEPAAKVHFERTKKNHE